MIGGIPITNYQFKQIKKYTAASLILFFSIFILGNVITALVKKSVNVSETKYTLKDGFPIFKSGKDYINIIKKYPYNPGVNIRLHRIKKEESFWEISKYYDISIDTIIAANPFINTLIAEEGIEIIIPYEDGVLMAFDDVRDVWRMTDILKFKGKIRGEYKFSFFKVFSTDDIRFVFFKDAEPELLNDSMSNLYSFKKVFQSPVNGYFTSLFGDRIDPFHNGIAFHDGLDIMAKHGTPIRPVRDGIVIFSGWRDGYGKSIMVQHYDGYTTLYAHCSKLFAKVGDWVTKEKIIGNIGSTGRSTGPHLHLVFMRHGEIINPINFIW